MRILFIFLTILSLQLVPIQSQANNESEIIALKRVMVVGRVPGPDLWKVTNGENVLWILGTLSPLPKKLDWNSAPIKEVIESSQALLLPPAVNAELGFFKSLSLARSAIGIKKNPQKRKLVEVLPYDLYMRWLKLKEKYMGDNKSIEKVRPIFASQKLFAKAIKKTGLKSGSEIEKTVRKHAKKSKLEMIQPEITIDLNNPKKALKKFKKTEIDVLECLTKLLDRLETELNAMRFRAIAWSYVDI
jgi:uncharacterized protein YbaP (TraB family)